MREERLNVWNEIRDSGETPGSIPAEGKTRDFLRGKELEPSGFGIFQSRGNSKSVIHSSHIVLPHSV